MRASHQARRACWSWIALLLISRQFAVAQPALPPPLPPARSPIDFFRTLLDAPPEEREKAIASKPEKQREYIRAKVKEYAKLPVDEREVRLQATELRWYLMPLMRTPAPQRKQGIASIPSGIRVLAEDRLREWDKLTPQVQQEVLESETAVLYFARYEVANAEQRERMLKEFPENARRKMEQQLESWRGLPVEERLRLTSNFNRFFELSPVEQARVLGTLSDAERRTMEETLKNFENLPPAQRRLCVASFEKFAAMPAAERNEFLRNVERWQTMTPAERKSWRELVAKLPPVPPGLGQPPMPPSPDSRIGTQATSPPATSSGR